MENNRTAEDLERIIIIISNDLKNGKSKSYIIHYLTNDLNLDHAIAKLLYNKVEEKIKPVKPQESIFKGIFSLLILYIFINVILWGGQELYYKNDMEKCENIKMELSSLKKELDNLENKLFFMDEQKERLDGARTSLKVLVDRDYKDYNKLVDEHNKNVPKYNNMLIEQKEKISRYNELTDEYNNLAKYAYSRWWLFPFPMPGNHNTNIN
ncbi:hypothetical protein CJ671_02420 [Aliarcobacter cryaerophilus]|uniref:Uncharacterized protein n=1 Tax=Aliarcobacter cryaerophilus TaxID=28198 RepID=A0A2S9SV48_9BACT|nr:hypothetical protein [Aliarcobacter cryaerophilus]PRM90464.1 hypothetical protein CJ671_02420 [Aliarcobacter cryaerophilus]